MTAIRIISREQDGARILFRFFKASNDSVAHEAIVREFSRKDQYVRLTRTAYKDDRGVWLRIADLVLIDVLADKVEITERPQKEDKRRKGRGKNKRIEGDEWKDADNSGELGLGDEEGDE